VKRFALVLAVLLAGAPVFAGDCAKHPIGGPCGGGGVRILDFGVIGAVDVANGPITLYTPAAGELLAVFVGDYEFCENSLSLVVGREEQILDDPLWPPLVGIDSDLLRDSFGWAKQDSAQAARQMVTDGPAVVGASNGDVLGVPADAWTEQTAYEAQINVVAAGHLWTAQGAGTSGAVAPDWESGFGLSVMDNDIEWADYGELAGCEMHLYGIVYTTEAYP
jgi:hypothetical protein